MTSESTSTHGRKPRGRVYVWTADRSRQLGGRIEEAIVSLPGLTDGSRLSGQFVEVRNAGAIRVAGLDGSLVATPLHDAKANVGADFCYEPGIGGGRLDKVYLAPPEQRDRYIQAAHFGEVNTYYHVDRIASYVDGLLQKLGEVSLPRVVVQINAHHAATENNGCRDGVRGKRSGRWLPFQGGHYRLSTKQSLTVTEHHKLSIDGEIHLGPGWRLTEFGALPEYAGRRYRCNASHNAGIIYHEYGHHITRHTADFRANRLKAPHCQNNVKTDVDEAYSDYWAATMLDCPHIWAFHRRHDESEIHPRSLTSTKTLACFDSSKTADPHVNGTILASTLWDLRTALQEVYADGSQRADLLVLQSLVLLGRLWDHPCSPTVRGTRRLRAGFSIVLSALQMADRQLQVGQHEQLIQDCFARRDITLPEVAISDHFSGHSPTPSPAVSVNPSSVGSAIERIRAIDPTAIIPDPNELITGPELEHVLQPCWQVPYSLIGVGDIMLGSRARRRIQRFGTDYTFHAVRPLFVRSHIVLGNLEGPFAKYAEKQPRNFSYKVDPRGARVLRRAGINVMTLANNHLLDCGRDGVLESLAALKKQGIACIGAGTSRATASAPAILQAGKYRVGLLGYYWNRRTSARRELPGSVVDTPEQLSADIRKLRPLVDRIVVTFHWGVPYARDPSCEDREKAHLAISLGADVVIGHHPHIIQPFEIFQNRPIFYSLGNFAFGTGNSRAESLIVAVRFRDCTTDVDVYPVYVKNRDPRADYQPKIMAGRAAAETLLRLDQLSTSSDGQLEIVDGIGQLRIPFDMPDEFNCEVSVVQER